MYKKLLIVGLVIIGMMSIASAAVRPSFVVEVYGLEPAVWLAIATGIGASIQHIGRYYVKKHSNPEMKYDPAYLYTSVVTILALCQGVAAIPVAELTVSAILFYLFSGLGINEGINKVTKVSK